MMNAQNFSAYANPHQCSSGFCDPAGDFVTENQRQFRSGKFSVGNMQIGAAYAAGMHLDQDLLGSRNRRSYFR